MRMAVQPGFVAALAAAVITAPFARALPQARVIYVDHNAQGASSGESWEDAFRDLQDALGIAVEGDEVWVAAGRYTPDRGTGDRSSRFEVPSGVAVYGGFAGYEPDRDRRDPATNETILTGDLNGDDGPQDCADFTDCCREHDDVGCDDASCEARVCALVSDCCCPPPGCPPAFSWDKRCVDIAAQECCEIGNWRTCDNTYVVASLSNAAAGTVLDGLVVSDAYHGVAEGLSLFTGGVLCNGGAPEIRNCTFRKNAAAAIFANASDGLVVARCTFTESRAGISGISTRATVADSTFLDRSGGSGLSGEASYERCIFAGRNSGIYQTGDLTVRDCIFRDSNTSGISHSDGHADIANCVFLNNWAGIRTAWSSAWIFNSTFIGHELAVSSDFAGTRLDNCHVVGGPHLPAIRQSAGLLLLINSTVIGSHLVTGFPAGVELVDARAEIESSILWNGRNYYGEGENAQIQATYGSTVEIGHSIVQGWTGDLGGVGNSGIEPQFVDIDGPDDILGTEDDNVRLGPGSPAINAGSPDPNAYLPALDLDGHARILCGRVDIGAYEFGIGDINCNRTVDLADFAAWSFCVAHPDAGSNGFGCSAFDFDMAPVGAPGMNPDATALGRINLRDFAGFQRVLSGP